MIGARLFRTTNLTLPASTWVQVPFDQVVWDVGGLYNSAQPTRLTIPADGDYAVGICGNAPHLNQSPWSRTITIGIVRNGGTQVLAYYQLKHGFTTRTLYAGSQWRFDAGDYVEMWVRDSEGSTLLSESAFSPTLWAVALPGWIAATSPSWARVTRTTNITMTGGQVNWIPFQAADYDTGGYWSGANPTRLTAPAAGHYLVGGQVWTTDNTGQHDFRIWINRATCPCCICYTYNYDRYYQIMTAVYLAAGNYVELSWQPPGGNFPVVRAAVDYSPKFWIWRIP